MPTPMGHLSEIPRNHRQGPFLELDVKGDKFWLWFFFYVPKLWLFLSPFQSEIICQMFDTCTDTLLGTKCHPSLENTRLVTHDRAQTTEDQCLGFMVGL